MGPSVATEQAGQATLIRQWSMRAISGLRSIALPEPLAPLARDCDAATCRRGSGLAARPRLVIGHRSRGDRYRAATRTSARGGTDGMGVDAPDRRPRRWREFFPTDVGVCPLCRVV